MYSLATRSDNKDLTTDLLGNPRATTFMPYLGPHSTYFDLKVRNFYTVRKEFNQEGTCTLKGVL
jgi:hypothetical protein